MDIIQAPAIITLIKDGECFTANSYHIPPIGAFVNFVTKGNGCILSGEVVNLEYDYEWSIDREQTYVRVILE